MCNWLERRQGNILESSLIIFAKWIKKCVDWRGAVSVHTVLFRVKSKQSLHRLKGKKKPTGFTTLCVGATVA